MWKAILTWLEVTGLIPKTKRYRLVEDQDELGFWLEEIDDKDPEEGDR